MVAGGVTAGGVTVAGGFADAICVVVGVLGVVTVCAITVAAMPTTLAVVVASPGVVDGRGDALSRSAFACDVVEGVEEGAGVAPAAQVRAVA